jgi:hypothetical protein
MVATVLVCGAIPPRRCGGWSARTGVVCLREVDAGLRFGRWGVFFMERGCGSNRASLTATTEVAEGETARGSAGRIESELVTQNSEELCRKRFAWCACAE